MHPRWSDTRWSDTRWSDTRSLLQSNTGYRMAVHSISSHPHTSTAWQAAQGGRSPQKMGQPRVVSKCSIELDVLLRRFFLMLGKTLGVKDHRRELDQEGIGALLHSRILISSSRRFVSLCLCLAISLRMQCVLRVSLHLGPCSPR